MASRIFDKSTLVFIDWGRFAKCGRSQLLNACCVRDKGLRGFNNKRIMRYQTWTLPFDHLSANSGFKLFTTTTQTRLIEIIVNSYRVEVSKVLSPMFPFDSQIESPFAPE